MGCDQYACTAWSTELEEYIDEYISFSEAWDGGCLCTFPENDGDELSADRVKCLAMLGAAVVLNHHGDNVNFLPYDLPVWIVDEIERVCNEDTNDKGSDSDSSGTDTGKDGDQE